jgi:RNA polymerase sigma-70 factor, ECF subfamily
MGPVVTDPPKPSLQEASFDPSGETMSAVYEELRRLAGAYFRSQPANHTLQPTALVHEAFLRLARSNTFESREHFFAVAATAMRQVLASHARKRRALKRGGDQTQVTLTGLQLPDAKTIDTVALDDALAELERLSPRQARIVVCRFFGGLTLPEIARALDVSLTTTEKEWRRARAWLAMELT